MARPVLNNNDIIADIARVATMEAKSKGVKLSELTPSREFYTEHGMVGIATVYRRFNSWNKAVEAAKESKGTLSAELIRYALRRESKSNNGKPLSRRASRYGKQAEAVYGTWSKAKEAAQVA